MEEEQDLTPEQLLEEMERDAECFARVAGLLEFNRTAVVHIAMQRNPKATEKQAEGFASVMLDVMQCFASDIAEAVKSVKSGERVMNPQLVDPDSPVHVRFEKTTRH